MTDDTDATPDDGDDSNEPQLFEGTYTAVLDRYEDTTDGAVAVLVVEADGADVAERLVERSRLPENCRAVDTVLAVTFSDNEPTAFRTRPDETAERSSDAQRRFDRLSRRRRSDDDAGG